MQLLIALVSAVAGAVASVAGFGIGSLLTPLFATVVDMRTAVAAVSIPHFLGTAVRFWRLRANVDKHVLLAFGITSAAGGLAGALLAAHASSSILTIVFGALLTFVGITGLTGLSERMRFRGPLAWIAGAASGLFGGLVGNQGGIRSAALLGFNLPRDAFVATATAIALFVDFARLPVYVVTQSHQIAAIATLLIIATIGVVAGTLLGERVLRLIPEAVFKRIVAILVLLLGIYMLGRGTHWWR
jgi:uncharacterized membrane protein YfcA